MNYFKDIIPTDSYFKKYIEIDLQNPNFEPLIQAAASITNGALTLDRYSCLPKAGCFELDLLINGKQVMIWVDGDHLFIFHKYKTKILNDILRESDYEGGKAFYHEGGSFRDLTVAFIAEVQYEHLINAGLMYEEEVEMEV